jgi:hypothetical protein
MNCEKVKKNLALYLEKNLTKDMEEGIKNHCWRSFPNYGRL